MRTSALLFILALLLAACGGDSGPDTAATPTPEPTLTFEERVSFDAGLAQNPLRMAIRPTRTVAERLRTVLADVLEIPPSAVTAEALLRDDLGAPDNLAVLNESLDRDFGVTIRNPDAIQTVYDLERDVQNQLGSQISAALFQRTGLYVDVVIVDTYGEAFVDLCDSGSGVVTIPWLDGVTYKAALARNCGEPALQVAVTTGSESEFTPLVVVESTAEVTPDATAEPTVEPEEEPETRVGTAGVIIANRTLTSGGAGLDVVFNQTYCRLGYDDFYTWLLPLLLYKRNGIDLLRAPETIVDYADIETLVQAVADGDCAVTGVSEDDYARFVDFDGIRRLSTSITFPYGVFFYPLEVGLGVRLTLNDTLQVLADSRPLHLLLGQDNIITVVPDDFAELDQFMASAGLDFAQLGN